MGKVCGKKMIKKILINMREDIKMIKNMDTENFNGVLAVSIKEIMYKTSKKDMVKCFGLMVQSIEVIGIKANKTGLVS